MLIRAYIRIYNQTKIGQCQSTTMLTADIVCIVIEWKCMYHFIITKYIKAAVNSINIISFNLLIKQFNSIKFCKMNKFTILLLAITIYASVSAEPPARGRQFRPFARQEITTEQEGTTENDQATTTFPSNGPYSPVGWRPNGRLLVLPSRIQQQPAEIYGPPPQQQYGPPPPQQYGPPQPQQPTTEYGTPEPDDDEVTATAEAEASDATDSNETTDEPESESVDVDNEQSSRVVQSNFNLQPQQTGYFIRLADGTVQQVLYVAPNAFTAKLQAQPVRAQPAVQAQPFFLQQYYVPQAVSFTSQYQSW